MRRPPRRSPRRPGFYREAEDDEAVADEVADDDADGADDDDADDERDDELAAPPPHEGNTHDARRKLRGRPARARDERADLQGYVSGEARGTPRLRKRAASPPVSSPGEIEAGRAHRQLLKRAHEDTDSGDEHTPPAQRAQPSNGTRVLRRRAASPERQVAAVTDATSLPPRRTRSQSRPAATNGGNGHVLRGADDDAEDDADDDKNRTYTLRTRKPVNYAAPVPVVTPERLLTERRDAGPGAPGTRSKKPHGEIARALFGVGSYSGTRLRDHERPLSDGSDSDVERGTPSRRGAARTHGAAPLPINAAELRSPSRVVGAGLRARDAPADADPVALAGSVDFDAVGGLDHHVNALKEMVMLPILYPEIYERFNIVPPRGVLFHGPPGTGKTLVARALASACSKTSGQKIAFFMRKGADCLSKWVGEAERQLRVLFDQAQAMQPSIIFFDEIDGLAPVRSAKQEQIHSSIVSTLLALMDGLTSRGQVVVIGATNRIDAIDPALRRPGRFDREFLFPLPDESARRRILDIHTRLWRPPLPDTFKEELAKKTKGFCGADLRALCTEAALNAVRRFYPEIYHHDERLLLDHESIALDRTDFAHALRVVVPTAQRSAPVAAGEPLTAALRPLLAASAQTCADAVKRLLGIENASAGQTQNYTADHLDDADDTRTAMFRPRLLLAGSASATVAAAAVNGLAPLPIQPLDLTTLTQDPTRNAETSLLSLVREAAARPPVVLLLPAIDVWWRAAPASLQAALVAALASLPPHRPVLFFATCDVAAADLPADVAELFAHANVHAVATPDDAARAAFWQHATRALLRLPAGYSLADDGTLVRTAAGQRKMRDLPRAPPRPAPVLTPEQQARQDAQDNVNLVRLRLDLRFITEELLKARKFHPFSRPVDPDLTEYYDIIKRPMDLSTILERINRGEYLQPSDFLADIELLANNCRVFHETHEDSTRLVSRAYDIADYARVRVADMDPALVRDCEDIVRRRHAARKGKAPDVSTVNGTMHQRASLRLRGAAPDALPFDLTVEKEPHRPSKQAHNDSDEAASAAEAPHPASLTLAPAPRPPSPPPEPQQSQPDPLAGQLFVPGDVDALVRDLVRLTSGLGVEDLLRVETKAMDHCMRQEISATVDRTRMHAQIRAQAQRAVDATM